MPTKERLIRFKVVAEYHRYDSKRESLPIQPDQSIAQRILKVRRVSKARNIMGLWKYRPTCAIEQYSNAAGRCRRSSVDRPVFIRRSVAAQRTMTKPIAPRKRLFPSPDRITVIPKSSLKMQNGMPIVKLKKNGRWNTF
jgi:hypothetical protein